MRMQHVNDLVGTKQVNRHRYRPSRGGHAPGHLREALTEALEVLRSDRPWWERLEIDFIDQTKQQWWGQATPEELF